MLFNTNISKLNYNKVWTNKNLSHWQAHRTSLQSCWALAKQLLASGQKCHNKESGS